jgi:hypothetical protein
VALGHLDSLWCGIALLNKITGTNPVMAVGEALSPQCLI